MKLSNIILLFIWASFGIAPAQTVNLPIRAWGEDPSRTNVPQNLTNVTGIAAGYVHAMALTSNGNVVAWGDVNYIYDGVTNVPPTLTNAVAIAAGTYHSLALTRDGRVVGWGYTNNGSCNAPTGVTNFTAVACGVQHSLGLTADNRVRAWGDNSYGQTNVPADLNTAIAISAGDRYSIALKTDGHVVVWGETNNLVFIGVPATLTNAIAISSGYTHALALTPEGRVLAWGDNSSGQCSVPASLTNAVAIAAGTFHSLALTSQGRVVTWGGFDNPELNPPSDLSPVRAIAAGHAFYMVLLDSMQTKFPPTITSQPKDQKVAVGGNAYFSVQAVGAPSFGYRWYWNNTNELAGQTNSILSLYNLQTAQSGAYYAIVSNGSLSTTSSPAFLSVLPTLDIAMAPVITLRGDVGLTYRVEFQNAASLDAAWLTLTNIILLSNPQMFVDLSAIGQAARFYRTVQLP